MRKQLSNNSGATLPPASPPRGPADSAPRSLLAAVFSNPRLGIAVFDLNLVIRDANDAFAAQVGLPVSELIGHRAKNVIPGWNDGNEAICRQVEATGQPWSAETEQSTYVRGGELIVTYWDSSVTPIYDGAKLSGLLLMRRDVTGQQRLSGRLLDSEQRFRGVVEQSIDGIVLIDSRGTIIEWNTAEEEITGVKREEALGRPLWDVQYALGLPERHDPGSYERLRAMILSALETGEAPWLNQPHERDFRTRDGHLRTLHSIVFPIRTPGGILLGSVSRDITEHERLLKDAKQRAADLEASNRELATLAYSISHDLRAPLRAIDGFSRGLEEDYADCLDAAGRDQLERVRAAAQRMGGYIDGLLTLSRLTRRPLDLQAVDLSSSSRAIAFELQESQPERRVEFVVADGIVARGDPLLLRVVLENLLENAWKFTSKREEARIEFGATQADGEHVFFVRDNGAGFDMNYAQKLFGPFQRLHRESEYPGLGIGLATVQRIISRHGGRVWAEAKVGEGATFYFTLGRL